jgi:hypothetical protein
MHTPSSPAPAETALPPSAFHGPHNFPDAGDHIRELLGVPRGAVVSLWNLVEPPDGIRPYIPYPLLMQIAIYGSEAKTLTLQGIYRAIAERFTFFKEQDRMGIAAWRVGLLQRCYVCHFRY